MTVVYAESQDYSCIKLDYLCGKGADMLCFLRGSTIIANPAFRNNAFLVEIKDSSTISKYREALDRIQKSLQNLNSDIRPKRAYIVFKEKANKDFSQVLQKINEIKRIYDIQLKEIYVDEIENSDLRHIKNLILEFE